jgi:hypothetical protein
MDQRMRWFRVVVCAVGCAACGYPPLAPLGDASTDSVSDMPVSDMTHVVLDWQIDTVLASGDPDPVIRFAPIDPAPRVRIAPIDGPFRHRSDDLLAQ